MSVNLPNYAAAVLDMRAGGPEKRVMCYPITLLLLIASNEPHPQYTFAVDDEGRWHSRAPFARRVEHADPCVYVSLLNRDDGAVRMECCPYVRRVLLLPAWEPKTPQLAFAPDAQGRWIETAATW